MRTLSRAALIVVVGAALAATPAHSGFLDKIFKRNSLSDDKIAAGLKEALDVGTANAVTSTGRLDGYFRNEAIRILMPEKLQRLDKGLRAIGFGSEIDAFVLSMNRAAEKAAPAARTIFRGAVGDMTFSDARQILRGGETAATDYFRDKTSVRLGAAFRPVVSSSLDEVGATKRYKDLVARYSSIPFVSGPSLDLDDHVTEKALDGLFHVLGEEERKIRKEPVARVTKTLREVFANSGR